MRGVCICENVHFSFSIRAYPQTRLLSARQKWINFAPDTNLVAIMAITFMNRLSYIITAVLSCLLLAGCHSDKFTVSGNFTDAGTQSIRIAYATGENIETAWLTIENHQFNFDGSSEEPTVVYIFNSQRKLIAHVVAKNGDEIKLEGELSAPYNLKISGTGENKEWGKFINGNSQAFADGNHKAIDAAIEKFIDENPDNIVSTLLLTNDYSDLTDGAKTKKLLSKISSEARPESLMKNFYTMMSSLNEVASKEKIQSINLYSSRDSMEYFQAYKHSLNLLYFWTNFDENRRSDINKFKEYRASLTSDRVGVIDIHVGNDTTIWKSAIRSDSTKWVRYWAVGGVTNFALRDLRLSSTPFYIVADSAGNQVYYGKSFEEACKIISSKIK